MLDLKKIESEVLAFWEKKKIYGKVKKKNEKGRKFYFLQGPPYTSGKLHIGHAWNSALKDMAMRYRRMKGFDVWDRAGYDMHGLPTENAVQKKLRLKTKEDITKYGVEKFVRECVDFSLEYAGYMNDDLWKIGVWMDYKNAYMPIKKDFISGQWAFFKESWKQKRLYKGRKVMHWDPVTETALAKHELDYKKIKDESVFLKFKRKKGKKEYFLIWTTTPWTIPFNLAIMVNPDVSYVKVKVDDEAWIIAKDLAGVFISGLLGKKLKIISEFKGAELEGEEYEHPLKNDVGGVYNDLKDMWRSVHTVILSRDYVDTSSGTGLVHCAPGCGPEDQEVGAEYGIGAFNTLNGRGEFEGLGKYTSWKAKEDDGKFINEFEKKGFLVSKTEIEHDYPHSWRSLKPVVFRTTEQWFLKTGDLAEKLLEFNKEVRWVPEKSGISYEKWAENLRDNSVTRQRFWGCPVPIWINTEDEGDVIVVGSVEELEKLSGKKFNDLSLHRPWIDDVIINKNGNQYKRISDVSDVWIDSGTASWNCLYNNPKLIRKYFPADLVLEATEQTKLWFSLLQICSAIMFDKSSYENVFTTGMMFDFQGMKMSKSLGNVISPYEVIDKYSIDVFRFYISGLTAGESVNFSWDEVKVKQRNLMILGNIANYILDLERLKIRKGKKGIEERWISSKYNSALKKITSFLEEYKLDETVQEIESLFMTLSRDYIKLVREKSSENSAVGSTLREIYLGILKMISITCPFLGEYLWRRMEGKTESVHLSKWPDFDNRMIDKNLEEMFELAFQVIEKGLAIRDKERMGLKWPLSKAVVEIPKNLELKEEIIEITARQLNVKEIEIKKGSKIDVRLNLKMTPELEAEGFARELSRRVQAERKKEGLRKGDEIDLKINASPRMKEMLERHLDFLKERTNSRNIVFSKDAEGKKRPEFKIKDEKVSIVFS